MARLPVFTIATYCLHHHSSTSLLIAPRCSPIFVWKSHGRWKQAIPKNPAWSSLAASFTGKIWALTDSNVHYSSWFLVISCYSWLLMAESHMWDACPPIWLQPSPVNGSMAQFKTSSMLSAGPRRSSKDTWNRQHWPDERWTHDGSMVLLYMVCHGSHQQKTQSC